MCFCGVHDCCRVLLAVPSTSLLTPALHPKRNRDTCRSEKALQATVKELQQQVDGAREAHALVVAELDVRT